MIEAVIFDMDGVIAHTSLIHAVAESVLFVKAGISISAEDIIKNYSGGKDIDTFRDVLKKAGVKHDPEKLREEKWRMIYGDPSHQNIAPIYGVEKFIQKLRSENYPLAVASSAPAKFVMHVLGALGFKKDFSVVTSGDEVSIGKPNDELRDADKIIDDFSELNLKEI